MKTSTFVVGLVTGVAFVVACEHGASLRRAEAAPSDCAIWQYTSQEIAADANGGTDANGKLVAASELPSGWQPFAVDSYGHIVSRRCKP